jgi:hypothetical protein
VVAAGGRAGLSDRAVLRAAPAALAAAPAVLFWSLSGPGRRSCVLWGASAVFLRSLARPGLGSSALAFAAYAAAVVAVCTVAGARKQQEQPPQSVSQSVSQSGSTGTLV